MADFKISGKMKVGTLKARFKESFGSTLRVYHGVGFANDDATVASIAKKSVKAGSEVSAHGKTKVGNFEKSVLAEYGIKVQIAKPDDSALSDNDLTLTQSGK